MGGPAAAACSALDHEGRGHVVCTVEAGADLRLWLRDGAGTILGNFRRLEQVLAGRGERLVFAMNAGMYHTDRAPVGLFLGEGGREGDLVTAAGPGNFGMLPNGVFCVKDGGFAVMESRAFAAAPPDCQGASQSGPMLVIDGDLHPRFLEDSTSRFVRNGVGVSADGRTAHFVISDRPVTFHEFGRLFRDVLETPQALYFDGNVSRLHAPALGRSDAGRRLGPMVGLVAPED
ncbi:MAG: phosphodiester glycosidase family protein [Alkalilacustris sp.]